MKKILTVVIAVCAIFATVNAQANTSKSKSHTHKKGASHSKQQKA